MGTMCSKEVNEGEYEPKRSNDDIDTQDIIIQDQDGSQKVEVIGMKNFKVIKCIGRGGFGKVMMVMKDDTYYAMKSIRKRDLMKQRLIL